MGECKSVVCAGVFVRERERGYVSILVGPVSSRPRVAHSFNHVAGHINQTPALQALAQLGKGDKVIGNKLVGGWVASCMVHFWS